MRLGSLEPIAHLPPLPRAQLSYACAPHVFAPDLRKCSPSPQVLRRVSEVEGIQTLLLWKMITDAGWRGAKIRGRELVRIPAAEP